LERAAETGFGLLDRMETRELDLITLDAESRLSALHVVRGMSEVARGGEVRRTEIEAEIPQGDGGVGVADMSLGAVRRLVVRRPPGDVEGCVDARVLRRARDLRVRG